MEIIKRIIKVPENRELYIRLPEEAVAQTDAEVTVRFSSSPSSVEEKLDAMREAASDPLYLADMHEVARDFAYADADEQIV